MTREPPFVPSREPSATFEIHLKFSIIWKLVKMLMPGPIPHLLGQKPRVGPWHLQVPRASLRVCKLTCWVPLKRPGSRSPGHCCFFSPQEGSSSQSTQPLGPLPLLPKGFPGGSMVKKPACQCSRCDFSLRVRKIPWRRAWQPTPVFLPGEFHGQRSLVSYSPWGHKEQDSAEHAHTQRWVWGDTTQTEVWQVSLEDHGLVSAALSWGLSHPTPPSPPLAGGHFLENTGATLLAQTLQNPTPPSTWVTPATSSSGGSFL